MRRCFAKRKPNFHKFAFLSGNAVIREGSHKISKRSRITREIAGSGFHHSSKPSKKH